MVLKLFHFFLLCIYHLLFIVFFFKYIDKFVCLFNLMLSHFDNVTSDPIVQYVIAKTFYIQKHYHKCINL